MKKKFTLISVILLILLAFTACSNDNDPAQIYIDYQEYARYLIYNNILNKEVRTGIDAINIELDKDNYIKVFNTDDTNTNRTLQYYINRIEKLSLNNTTFEITDVSGTYKYTSEEKPIDENTRKKTGEIELDNIIVKYTLTREGVNEKPQEFQVSFTYKYNYINTYFKTDSEYKYEYNESKTYSINGVNKGTAETKYSESSTSEYTVNSVVFNGTDITKFYNTIYM